MIDRERQRNLGEKEQTQRREQHPHGAIEWNRKDTHTFSACGQNPGEKQKPQPREQERRWCDGWSEIRDEEDGVRSKGWASPFDSPTKKAWRLKVRVLRTLIVPSFGNHNVANSMEVVLVDADSNKIQTTVKKQLINRFKENIIEGQTYRMAYFSIVANQGNYRAAEHEFKLVFLNRTSVVLVPDDAIPKTCFSFYPFDELLKMTEDYFVVSFLLVIFFYGNVHFFFCNFIHVCFPIDVIGLLTSVGEEKEYVKDDKVMKMIVLELSSKELTIHCALFGEYVDEVHHFLGSGYMEQPVVVIQLAKVKFFRGHVGRQNVMHATRLFFNPDLAEVVNFKNSKVDQGINGTQPLFIANKGKGVSLEDDFMRLTMRCTIEELHDNNEEGSFVVFGIVRSIVDEGPWWYSACACGKYRIKVAVEDDNGHGVFVLFDREAAYLLKKSCANLFGEVQKDANVWLFVEIVILLMFQQLLEKKLLLKIDAKSVGADKYFGTFRIRRVCDDAAIIAMFELPNYNADDERTPVKVASSNSCI
ncbi:uncharacterized protein LOC107647213 [Arachis ipaensis]|uniref:uncharacterized protein LOC107647213 n=1 Tax=Arachis ipaensis TaxID=130454 RepID=UPI000A2B072E|nr:uncharacterized protein LOC107647213 [Arachis ipaensis]